MSFKNQTFGNRKSNLDELLQPSWLSGLIAVTVGLVVTVGVLLVFSFNNSPFQQQLTSLQNTSSPTLTLPGQAPPGTTENSLENTWPLMGFWALVGLVIYFIVETVVNVFHNIEELREEMDYVHARRDLIVRTTVEYLLIRLLAVTVWLFFIDMFFKKIIPYSILAAHAAASDLHTWQGYLYALMSFFMIATSLQLHTIFLRLSLRRTRVFSSL